MQKTVFRYVALLLSLCLTGCFRPNIPISTGPKFPVDVFYAEQLPGRAFTDLKLLYISHEVPVTDRQKTHGGRMLSRGNSMLDKDALLAKLTLQAKRLGADALVNVRYQYYTNATANGYSMEGMAVKYNEENE